ncbi:MAG: SUMF1/EgtB/PvdO family nonheme iron enzyme [Bacteroidota bacterium]
MASDPINIFIAYSRKDKPFLDELRTHLRILQRNNTIQQIWYDGEIIAGQKWDEVIEAELEKADILLMLLSADFINSDYAYGKEMRQALERHERGEAIVIPIIARACAWDMTPLAELQAPIEGKALGSATEAQRQDYYTRIIRDIAKAADQRRAEKENTQRYFADKEAWENALKLNSINAFNAYLEQHPNGTQTEEARQAIARIHQQKENERQEIERKAWQQAQAKNTEAAYKDYWQKYPNGRFVANANTAIQFLQQDRQRNSQTADQQSFQQAKQTHTVAAYRQYLVNFPNGRHQKAAYRTIRRLEQSPRSNDSLKKVGLGVLATLVLVLGIWGIKNFSNDAEPTSLQDDSVVENENNIPSSEISSFDFPIPEMVFVEGGTFIMGCQDGRDSDCEENEKPAHKITLNNFYIGKYEVTVEEYLAFVDATSSHYPWWLEKESIYNIETGTKKNVYKELGYGKNASKLPIVGVSWRDATAYCRWLQKQTGKNYRLPTEAQWEYAARGGQRSLSYQYSGSNSLSEVAYYPENSNDRPHDVGSKKANELNLYDMSGNVMEQCNDYYSYHKNSSKNNTTNNSSTKRRAIRGGSWNNDASLCRIAYRYGSSEHSRGINAGFRVVY